MTIVKSAESANRPRFVFVVVRIIARHDSKTYQAGGQKSPSPD